MPRTKEKFNQIKDERRENILLCALKLFSIQGYDSITIDKITRDAKCSHSLFYHYYASKEDIFIAILKMSKIRGDLLREILESKNNPKVRLTHLIEFYFENLSSTDEKAFYLNMYMNLNLQKTIPSSLRPRNKKTVFKQVVDLIEEGQALGQFYPGKPTEYACALMSILKGLSFNRLNIDPKKFVLPSINIILNMIVRKENAND